MFPTFTINLWEKNKVQPSVAQIPKIIEFVGRDPFEEITENLGDKLRSCRKLKGLSQKKFAQQLGVDPSTLSSWERRIHQPTRKQLENPISSHSSLSKE
jgi:DNA-binding XRE family transcriptional regulator